MILDRARLKIAAATRHLPKYTCAETIDRSYFTRVSPGAASLCDQSSSDAAKARASLRLQAIDRVRLDVSQGDGSQIHSWPGAGRLEPVEIDRLITRGPAGTGGFGGYLIDIFGNEGTQFDFQNERSDSGRRVFTYGYRVTGEVSHYQIGAGDGWVTTPYDGTFDLNVDSLELLRLTVVTPALPAETGLCEARSTLDYTPIRIGSGEFLLPRQSALRLEARGVPQPGERSEYLVTESASAFTNCREYLADAAPPAVPNPSSPLVLPTGVHVTLRLDAAIDSDIAAMGDPVTATLLNSVHAGATVHGRISRMEQWRGSSSMLIVGIHWDSISLGGDSAPLAALIFGQTFSGPTLGRVGNRPAAPNIPEIFSFPTGAKRYVIPAGYKSQWITVQPQESK